MKTFYYAVNSNGDYLFDNFPSHLVSLITNFREISDPFEVIINGIKHQGRLGKKSNNFGTMYTLTIEEKYVIRKKLFKELLEISTISLESVTNLQKSIIEQHNKKAEEFIHNVTTLNGYSIQDLFTLIPQDTLSENINKQKEIIKALIIEKPNNTVITLLQLIKYNIAMKVEFSVFERTQKAPGFIKKFSHSIRGILLSILQIFIEDFEKKEIEVSLDAGQASERRIEVDYDSLFVSFFYLLENSVKYCCPKTKYKIIFKEETNHFAIIFNMISIKIESSEVSKLTEHSYRSDTAKKINAEGKGIGMYRITKTLKFNNAEIEITPRINDFRKQIGNIEYEGNQFKIKFIGQQNWFLSN